MADDTSKEFTVAGERWSSDFSEQTIVENKDKGGHVLKHQIFNGVYYPCLSPRRILQQLRHFKMRTDDVYVPGFSRTGTNWTYEMTSMLLNGEAKTIPSMKPILEMLPHDRFEKFPSPRVITTHVGMSEAPEDIKIKKCKTIFTLRDPRDVAVSMYKITYGKPWSDIPYYGSFEDYFYLFLEGKVDYNGLFHHWRDAENFFNEHPDVPVHFHSYEEALQDPVLAVNKLSDFLGLPRNDRLCRDVAEKCEFSKLKADKEPYAMKLDGENFLFRQGKTGDWKNWFTEQMLEDYYRVYDEMLTGSMFYDRYSRSNMKEI